MKIIVGSRGSKLALTQTHWIIDQLKVHFPKVDFEVQVIQTKGDRIQNVALNKIGDKGLFTKELEYGLLEEDIHMAVHSLKDMPSQMIEGLILAPYPQREDPRDVLVTKHNIQHIKDLPKEAKLGTGSKRRRYQLLQYRSDLQIVDIRGNIDTRIRKIFDENLDGVILAAAGINRLNLKQDTAYTVVPIETDIVLPAPGQGILTIQMKKNNEELLQMVNRIQDPLTNIQGTVERQFLNTLQGNCHIPIGAYCKIAEDEITLEGLYGSAEGERLLRRRICGTRNEYKELGARLAFQLLEEMKS